MSQNTGGQRAFALKRSKMTAADVRRHIMTGSLLLQPQSILQTESTDGCSRTIHFVEIVEPLDIEDILSQRKNSSSVYEYAANGGNLRRVAEFPVDDVEVRLMHRDQLTVESPVPSDLSSVDPVLKDTIQTYKDDYSLVQRKYQQYSSGDAYIRLLMERSIIARTAQKQIYEVDLDRPIGRSVSTAGEEQIAKRDSFGSHYSSDSMCTIGSTSGGVGRDNTLHPPHQLHSSASDITVPGVIQRISNLQLDQINEARRQTGRQNAVITLLPTQPESDVIELRSTAPFPVANSGLKIFVKVLQLQLEPSFEPIFGIIALYDVREKRKVSENFYFDMNDEVLSAMVSQHVDCVDEASKCTQAVFSISQSLSDIFMVVKLEKVLQPCEVADACEPYLKEEKNKERLMQTAQQYCERLGAFRMPLGWIAIDLNRIFSCSHAPDKSELPSTMTASVVTEQDVAADSPLPFFDVESIISVDRMSNSTMGTFRRVGSGTSANTVYANVQHQKCRTPIQKRKIFGGLHHSAVQIDTTAAGSYADADSLVKDGGSAVVSMNSLEPFLLHINFFFRQEAERLSDEDLCKMLVDYRKGGSKLARLKAFPITFKMELSTGYDETLMRLTPELLRVHPFVSGGPTDIVKEIAEFPTKGIYVVNSCYRNLLYIYPRSVNLSGRSGPSRNISVHVELMNAEEKPVCAVFGKSSGPNIAFFADTAVSYHNKTPNFYDEIKINLPVDLNDGHHLLFTFFHITCKLNKAEDEVKTPIGYAWIPLLKDGRLQTGEYILPIALERLPQSYGYLSPDVNLPNIKWLEGHKPLFEVRIEGVTTVHTQDAHLDKFFLAYHSVNGFDKRIPPVSEVVLKEAVRGVIKARPEPMVAFLYIILNKLLALIANPPYTVSISAVCFEVIGQLVKICTVLLDGFRDAHGRSSLLTTYIHYHKIAIKVQGTTSLTESKTKETPRTPASPESEHLLDIIRDFERTNYLKESLEEGDESKASRKVMHEELVLLWVISGGAAREMAFLNSWFFLELMIKAMAEYLSISNRLYLPRKLRFSEPFIQDLNALSQAIVNEIIVRTSKDPRQSQSISISWAFFLRDCLSLMDRTYVFTLIRHFNREMAAKISNSTELCMISTLMLIKLDFLRIIASHEHFIVLNLPFGLSAVQGMSTNHSGGSFHSATTTLSSGSESSGSFSISLHHSAPQIQPSSPGNSSISSRASNQSHNGIVGSAELTYEFRSRHFLIGLLLSDLASVLDTSNTLLHSRAISLIRSLFGAHELDARLLDNAVKARVASLYLPLIGIVLDASIQLHDPYSKFSCTRSSMDYESATFVSNDCSLEIEKGPFISDKVMLAIGGINFTPPCSPSTEQKHITLVQPSLSLENTRQLLACVCWTLKNMERSCLRQWIRELSTARISQFLDVLQLAVSCFEFKPAFSCSSQGREIMGEISRSKLDHANNFEGSGTKESIKKKSRGTADYEGVRWRKEAKDLEGKSSWKSSTHSSGGQSSTEPMLSEEDFALEAALCTEVPLIVLDTLELIIRVVSVPGSDHLFFVLPSIFKVLTLENIFASQRAIVTKHPDLLFEQETEQCGELCLHLLRHCASRLPAIRSQAAASLYLLMRQSFESGASFSKVKMQITMSLSTLVSTGTKHGDWINEDCLRRSLKTVLTYSETDASTDSQLRATSFAEQVKDLVFNLHMILSDTVKMKEYTNDFEMLIDLMYRVAKGYQNNPDLRLTWLINMANKHSARNNAAEAAQCMLHAAALAAEYISMREYDACIPQGAAAFEAISDNILEESAVSDDVISPDEEGICESRHFTQNGLIITPVLEVNRDYRHLAQVHSCLSNALSRIEPTVPLIDDIADAWFSPLPSADRRCFGTYFRVGFYGSRFADLDGVEFIYKEPAITKLSEISHRLDSFYSDRFGKGTVEVIKDSNIVDRSRLDLAKAYLQITYVEPYLENWERRRRPTHFERNYKLYRFVYATPFTKDGRAHGDLKDQYKRRTVLTTQYCFPYVKTRLRVVDREQTILTPIEVAIEDVQKRTRELAAATAQNPPDAKMLQMVLQGCIGATVNQGPIEVANVFLTNVVLDERGRPKDKFQNKLRLCFKDFSKKCADALQKNKQLIQADQQAYQNELQKNYIEFTKRMAPIVGIRKNKCSDSHLLKAAHAAAIAAELGPVTAV